MRTKSFIAGFIVAAAARAGFPRLLRYRFARDVRELNAGNYSGLLGNYSDDFVLRFNVGEHRWSGDWVGKAGMERFLQNFTAARIQGEIRQIAISGPPWRMTIWARFDDHADAPDGTRMYENRTALLLRTRWGKVVEQEDFYEDTTSILEFDKKLTELGVDAIPKPS